MAVTDLTQRIHKLSTVLANQIAAGEVIERPASVVKELLENSLDAGASEIKLDIRKGGRLLINIQDNGCGIHPDDLSLALAHHATSKLITEADLTNINTLGFRGEALSSIASVSRLKLSSRIANEEHGWTIDVTQGDAQSEQVPTGMTVGTSVEVRDLFFNTPARRKFLRTDNTEFFHIREIVRRVALSRYDVSFYLKHNNKTILQCSGNQKSIANRVQVIFGKSFLSNAFEFNYERDGLRLWGWFGHPEIARNQMDQQYFYLNGRMIRDKQVNHAVRMATQDHFYTGKHAVYILFLEMDADGVDVNVHPAKHEVRFHQARDVHDFIYSSLMQACAGNNIRQDIQEQGAQYSSHKAHYKNHNESSPDLNNFLMVEDRYLITQMEDETFLMDVLLCHEIIVLSKLEEEFENQGVRSRPLLVPLTMAVSTEEANLIERESSVFESFGMKTERVAPDSLLIREVPLLLEYADITKLINEMMQMIKSDKSSEEIIRMMSRHVNDAGLTKMDTGVATQLMAELRLASMSSAEKSRNSPWRMLDSEMLGNLLKRKI